MDLEFPRALVGAAAKDDDGEDATLPLTVWLRGDEAYVGEFALDADQVMAQLGIRRSRLTQISGKELRVGRIRRGRYVAPVYRQTDVETYLSWTRATASHVKSSAVLNDAAAALKEESSRVTAALDAASQETRRSLKHIIEGGVAATVGFLKEPLHGLGANLASLAAEGRYGFKGLSESSEVQAARLAAVEVRLAAQQAALSSLASDLAAAVSLIRQTRNEEAVRNEDLHGTLDAVGSLLSEIISGQVALAAALHVRPKARREAAAGRRLAHAAQVLSRGSKPAPPASAGGKRPTSQRSGSGGARRPRKVRRESI